MSKPRMKEYSAWVGMKQRCNNPNHHAFKHYGGRGIGVCERWLSFKNFLTDMGLAPSSKHSLDRINNAGNYEPNNCRWATWKEQANNKSNIKMVEIGGVKKPLHEWAQEFKLNPVTVRDRIKVGRSDIQALTVPTSEASKWCRKPVIQLTKDLVFVARFAYMQEAGNAIGRGRQDIRKCCIGLIKTCGGFKWMYESDYLTANKNK